MCTRQQCFKKLGLDTWTKVMLNNGCQQVNLWVWNCCKPFPHICGLLKQGQIDYGLPPQWYHPTPLSHGLYCFLGDKDCVHCSELQLSTNMFFNFKNKWLQGFICWTTKEWTHKECGYGSSNTLCIMTDTLFLLMQMALMIHHR